MKKLFSVEIPAALRKTVEQVHGDTGRQWLATLPALLSEFRERWQLDLDKPFENLSYNLVLPGRMAEGAEAVLKLGVPCQELSTETAALTLFQGIGVVRLLDHDVTRGALLLERALPGTPLHNLQAGPEATRTAATLMVRLWRTPAPNQYPSLQDWFQACERHLANEIEGLPAELVAEAAHTFSELNDSAARCVVLHGDLHHANILYSDKRGWLAIDPKGVLGDPGYEVGSFMLNQLPIGVSEPETMAILARRLSIFSQELDTDPRRLARWAFCHAVLSALWDFEESADCCRAVRLARMLERLGEAVK